ncbi:MAG: hypothetical protein HY543_11495 [Deltaproteobacteria bacterium]|nr:hypothetical protein [Deltaproteobacteria bacterium]
MAIEWKQAVPGREKLYFPLMWVLIVVMFGRMFWGPRLGATALIKEELENVNLQVQTLAGRLEEVRKHQEGRPTAPAPAPAPTTEGKSTERFAEYLLGKVQSRQAVLGSVIQELTGPQILRGLVLNGHSVGSDVDGGNYLSIPLELNLEGQFPATVQYLSSAEKLPLLFTIDNLTLSAPPERPGQIQTKLMTTVYVVKSASALPGDVAPLPPAPAPAPSASPGGAS